MRTAIVYSHKYLEHETGNHPERPQRLVAAVNGINKNNLIDGERILLVEPRYASQEELQLVHTRKYIEMVRVACKAGGGLIDEETPVSRESFNVARLAAGGAIYATQKVSSGEFRNAFVLARPPGHHAEPNRALGFCIFNNVALAAKFLLEKNALKKILILDIDAHHGNGTQKIFYETDMVLYISIHEDPTEFPKIGFIWEVGAGDGEGYTVNIPLSYGSGDPSYWRAFKTIVLPIARQYKPQFILVSAGFDGYYKDTISELMLSAQIYVNIFREVLNAADKLCGGKLVAVLEGGYNLWFLRRIIGACVAKMANKNIKVGDRRPPIDVKAERKAKKIIENVRKIQSRYWSL
jgi:acetoin utilization deacetylase AcuC-like enzyme